MDLKVWGGKAIASFLSALWLVLFLLTGIFQTATAQSGERGHPWIETYRADSYGTWEGDLTIQGRKARGVTQDARGIIYVANQHDVLSFDGSRWSALSIPQAQNASPSQEKTDVLSIHRLPGGHADAGRILVGGRGTFGFLRPDPRGVMQYESLLSRLPAEQRKDVGAVRNIAATAETAYFQTTSRVYAWRGDSLGVWSSSALAARSQPDAPSSLHFSGLFSVQDTVYVQVQGAGLYRAGPTSLERVPGGEAFANIQIRMLLLNETGAGASLLVGSHRNGLFRLSTSGNVDRVDWPVESWLREKGLTDGLRLPDGTYVFATQRGGLLRTTGEGRRMYVLDASTGLQTNRVQQVFLDRRGSAWLALADGVARVDLLAPFTYFSESLGLASGVEALARYEGALYGCTRDGLHRMTTAPGQLAEMSAVEGVEVACTVLLPTNLGLLVGTTDGTRILQAEAASSVVRGAAGETRDDSSPDAPTSFLQASPDTVFMGTAGGTLRRLTVRRGRWTVDPAFPSDLRVDTAAVRHLVQTEEGSLWASSARRLIRVTRALTSSPVVTRYGAEDNLPVGDEPLRLFAVRGSLRVSTQDGLRRLAQDPPVQDEPAFVPDTTLETTWAHDAYVTHVVETETGGVWARAIEPAPGEGRVITSLYQGPEGRLYDPRPLVPFRDDIEGPFLVEGNVIWVGKRGIAPLSRFDFSGVLAALSAGLGTVSSTSGRSEAPLIRRISADGGPALGQRTFEADRPLEISSQWSRIHIEYALPRYMLVATPVEYRTRLQPDGWSPWSRAASVTYDDLSPGTYSFEVQARLPGEEPSSVRSLSLRVTPLWYQTTWAWGLWGILALGGIIGIVVAAVRWRTSRLEQRQEELQASVASRTREVREQNETLTVQASQLEDQAERLRSLDQDKSRFFANISHEFRTPLTLILGPTRDATRAGADIPADQAPMIQRNAERLLRLINQLLDLSALDAGGMTPKRSVYDLAELVRHTTRAFVPLAERRQVALDVEIEPDVCPSHIDADQIEKVTSNLLSNALKFTPTGGTVDVRLYRPSSPKADSGEENRAGAPVAHLVVRDTGPGIPEDAQPYLFDRFYRDGREATNGEVGSGIGLSLVKELVELHGGTVRIQSAQGEGTTVSVSLPVLPSAEIERSLPQTPSVPLSESSYRSPSELSVPSPEALAASGDPAPDEPAEEEDTPVVLVVDDNADIRRYVRSVLEDAFRIEEAANGAHALETATEVLPDCIVADVMMPEMDGFEMGRALMDDPMTEGIPLLYLTARATVRDEVEGLELGADAYLKKPFSAAVLTARVHALIEKRMRVREMYRQTSDAVELDSTVTDAPTSPQSDLLKRAHAIMQTHLTDPDFGVQTLADALNLSRSHLNRRIKEETEYTASQWMRTQRLEHGRNLLQNGEGSVTEVAYAVGFNSLSYFSRTFKEHFGQPPSAVS